MAKPNEINDRIDNKYGLPGKSIIKQTKTDTNGNCADCSGKGKLFIIPESYQVIKYVNFFTGKTHFKESGGFPFIKLPWYTHIEIIDKSEKLINLPQICDFKTQDGVSVVADLYIQYTISDYYKYNIQRSNLQEKVSENIKDIMQQYFRNNKSEEIAKADISMNSIGKSKFDSIQTQYGIRITTFGCTKLKLPQIDDNKTKQVEMRIEMKTREEQLEFQKGILQIEKEIALLRTETNNDVRKSTFENILSLIKDLPKEQQAPLLKQIYEIERIAENSQNTTYVGGNLNFPRQNVIPVHKSSRKK